MKLQTAKFFNAVRVANKQVTYIDSKDGFTIELTGNIVKITPDGGNAVFTSLYNTPYWTELPEEKEVPVEKKKSSTNESRTSTAPKSSGKKKKKQPT